MSNDNLKSVQVERFDPSRWAMQFGVDVSVAVSELPDRTSPDDWPEAMLVEASELSQIIEARILPELDNAFQSGHEEGYAQGARDVVDPVKHNRAIMACVKLGSWMSAALDDPTVCDEMKADIREWFSAGEPQPGWCGHIAESASNTHDELVSALEPFARYADALDAMIAFHGGTDIADKKVLHVAGTAGLQRELRLGDFRKARAALTKAKSQSGGAL